MSRKLIVLLLAVVLSLVAAAQQPPELLLNSDIIGSYNGPDRLNPTRWKPAAALIVSNIGFALWHYQYLKKGLLEGSLMIFLTFLAGFVISLSYLKTRNSLSSVISHTGVDAPGAIRELMGIVP